MTLVSNSDNPEVLAIIGSRSLRELVEHSANTSAVVVVPTSHHVRELQRLFGLHSPLSNLPHICTLAGFTRQFAAEHLPQMHALSGAETSLLFTQTSEQSSASHHVRLNASQLTRWKQEGYDLAEVQRVLLDAEIPHQQREFNAVLELWSSYEHGKGLWGSDAADVTSKVIEFVNRTPIPEINASRTLCVMATHGVSALDRLLLQALAEKEWSVGIQLLPDPANSQRSADAEVWFVSRGWESQTLDTEAEARGYTTVHRAWHSRTEEIRRTLAWIKQNSKDLDVRDVCIVLPQNAHYNNLVIEHGLFAGVPLRFESERLLAESRTASLVRSALEQHVSENTELITSTRFVEEFLDGALKQAALDEDFIGIDATATLHGIVSYEQRTYESLLETAVSYRKYCKTIGIASAFLKQHIDWWWELIRNVTLPIPPSPFYGVSVLRPSMLRMQTWKYIFAVGFVDGEFPRRAQRGVENYILPDLQMELQHEMYADITSAVGTDGFLICSRPLQVDMDDTLPSEYFHCKTERTITANQPTGWDVLDGNLDFALEVFELLSSDGELPLVIADRQKGIVISEESSVTAADHHKRITEQPISPSRVDTVTMCPYRFYSKYLLGLKDDSESEDQLSPLERGIIMHEVARKFFESFKDRDKAFPTSLEYLEQMQIKLPIQDSDALYERLLDTYYSVRQEYRSDHLYQQVEERMLLDFEGRAGLLRRWLNNEISIQQETLFLPTFFELDVRQPVQITPEHPAEEISLRIDRVDTAVHNGEVYFVVVDYKTTSYGVKTWNAIGAGKASQMPLYLQAVKSLLEKNSMVAVPFGAVYRTFGKSIRSHNDPTQKIAMGVKNLYKAADFSVAGIAVEQLEKAMETIPPGIKALRNTSYPVLPEKGACTHCSYNELCRIADWKTSRTQRNLT